jgi:hypothetical protein
VKRHAIARADAVFRQAPRKVRSARIEIRVCQLLIAPTALRGQQDGEGVWSSPRLLRDQAVDRRFCRVSDPIRTPFFGYRFFAHHACW